MFASKGFNIFVILGATGDLVDKKIIPALYALFLQNIINTDSIKIIAFARRDFTNGKYQEIINHSLQTYGKIDVEKVDLTEFYSLFDYHQGQFNQKTDFVNLADKINQIQNTRQICANKIFYMAIPTDLYSEVVSHITDTQLQDMCSTKPDVFSQLIIEKPFGSNLTTSKQLDQQLKKLFNEEQIYRIDHYLGKSVIEDIIHFRKTHFTNAWNKNVIKSISISTVENLSIDNRGAFYDEVGALVDVGQNHLLELMAILTMPLSQDENSDYQSSRGKMMSLLKIFNPEDIKKYTYRAQYVGYRQVANVKPNSNKETYFKIVSFLDHPDWQNVPFYLESGKRCGITKKEIVVNFYDGQKIVIDFTQQVKITVDGELLEQDKNNDQYIQYVGEYTTLFAQALGQQRENFVSIEEIESAWKFIDPIRLAWDENLIPLEYYQPDDIAVLNQANLE